MEILVASIVYFFSIFPNLIYQKLKVSSYLQQNRLQFNCLFLLGLLQGVKMRLTLRSLNFGNLLSIPLQLLYSKRPHGLHSH